MKHIISLLFYLAPIWLIAQKQITETSVKRIFTESIVKKNNGRFTFPSELSWNFQNEDSLYYKQDTLTAIRYKSTKHKKMCEIVNWSFYKKNKFILGKESLCKEPPSGSATKYPQDYFTIAIYRVENEIMIDILNQNKIIMESFIVLEMDQNDERDKIILVRRFNPFEK